MAGESAHQIWAEGLAALEAELRALETEASRAIAGASASSTRSCPRTDKTSELSPAGQRRLDYRFGSPASRTGSARRIDRSLETLQASLERQ
jgi:hypothetical protein